MSRYIDADALIKDACNNCDGWCDCVNCDCLNCKSEHRCDFVQQVLEQPTVDAVPVAHGEWIDEQRGRWIYAKCNLCGKVQDVRSNYCPNCGCRMDGKEQTDE